MPQTYEMPLWFRDRAQHLRDIAGGVSDPERKQHFLDIAEEYKLMAWNADEPE